MYRYIQMYAHNGKSQGRVTAGPKMSQSAPVGQQPLPMPGTPQGGGEEDVWQNSIPDAPGPDLDQPPPPQQQLDEVPEEEQVVTELPPAEDPMAAHIAAGGVVSTYHNAAARKQRLERKQAADFVGHVREEVEKARKDLRGYEERVVSRRSCRLPVLLLPCCFHCCCRLPL
eukprot:SAG22_NODE_2654_length_2333_cov_207.686213_5_plen_171_part_00